MRVQKIDESTLRVFLSLTELAERNISMVDLFQRSAQIEQHFCEMIAMASEEVEFVLDRPFWIQAQIMSGEEFVITVIKQDSEEELEEIPKPKPKRRSKYRNNYWVYRFEDWEQIVSLTQALGGLATGKSNLYYYQPAYYLVLSSRGITGTLRHKYESLLKEYGEQVNLSEPFLQEHAKSIQVGDALGTVRHFFGKFE